MSKTPYVSVSAKFTLKNKPANHPGVFMEDWRFGREGANLRSVAGMLIVRLVEFWFDKHPEMTEDKMLVELAALSGFIAGLKLEAEPEQEDHRHGNRHLVRRYPITYQRR